MPFLFPFTNFVCIVHGMAMTTILPPNHHRCCTKRHQQITAYPGADEVVALEDEAELTSPDKPPEGSPEAPPEEEASARKPEDSGDVPLPSDQAEVVYSGACQLVSIKRVLVGRCGYRVKFRVVRVGVLLE